MITFPHHRHRPLQAHPGKDGTMPTRGGRLLWLVAAACLGLMPRWVCGQPQAKGGLLRWERTQVELAAGDAAILEARYPFENAGSGPVEITALQSDCGCTVPELVKRRYEPGEKGQILARFSVGERVGREERHVTVTVTGQGNPTVLTLTVLIPELLRVQPTLLYWSQGEEKTPKRLIVEAGKGVTVRKLAVTTSQALFTPELRILEEGRRYELTVTPGRTDLLLMAHLPLSGEFVMTAPQTGVEGQDAPRTLTKVLTVYAAVKTPATAPVAPITAPTNLH